MARPKEARIKSDKWPISYWVAHKSDFEIDRTYQREDVWSRDLQQYLVDTILKGYDIGRIYIQWRDEAKKYFIIDGQQRLKAIWDFVVGGFSLDARYSGELGAKKYDDLPRTLREEFDVFNIMYLELLEFGDEEIRDLYRRINSGVPLNTAERLNAYPGNIVLTMRNLAENSFFEQITHVQPTRYRYYHLVAQLMLLEKDGITDISPKFLSEFFEKNRNLGTTSETYRKIAATLDYLKRAFKSKTMELAKPSWVITLYLLTSHLLKNYVMEQRENSLKLFFTKFYQDVQNSSNGGDRELIGFNFAISKGTTSETNIKLRHDVIFRRFIIDCVDLLPKDPKRDFTREEKIAVFRRDGGTCQAALQGGGVHRKPLSMDDFHVHHIKSWSQGGKSTLDNALLVCEECHKKLHSGISTVTG